MDEKMRKAYSEHDCKAAPDHGCQGCYEYMEYFHRDAPDEEVHESTYAGADALDRFAEHEFGNQLSEMEQP